jgi:hypothetical protein
MAGLKLVVRDAFVSFQHFSAKYNPLRSDRYLGGFLDGKLEFGNPGGRGDSNDVCATLQCFYLSPAYGD